MASIIYAGRVEKGRQFVELAGLSTETKPTEGILGGSRFHELDTTKIFAYSQANDTWYFQMQLGEPEESAGSQLGGSLGGGFGGLGGSGGTYQGGQEDPEDPEQPDDPEQEGEPEETNDEQATPEDGEDA